MSSPDADRLWDEWSAAREADPELEPRAFAARHGARAEEVLSELELLIAVEESAPLPPLIGVIDVMGTGAGDEARELRFAGFRLVRHLGEGSSGVVYEARDERLEGTGGSVALKILNPLVTAGAERRRALLREARIAQGLDHPGIIHVLASGVERGYAWIATELVEGGSLEQWIDAELEPEARVELALDVGLQVAAALEHAHGKGVVHRDLKPANLVRDGRGVVKVLDFGLARSDAAAFALSRTGEPIGTPLYMAPEQLRGVREVGPESDLYSLGLILLELATGRRLLVGEDAVGTLARIARGGLRLPRRLYRGLPAPLSGVLSRCLEPHRADRPPGAARLAADLRAIRAGDPPALRRLGPLDLALRRACRHPWRCATAVASALAATWLAWWVVVTWPIEVRIDSWKDGKIVTIDGEEVGQTPASVSLRPGHYEVVLAAPRKGGEEAGERTRWPLVVERGGTAHFFYVRDPDDDTEIIAERPGGDFAYVQVSTDVDRLRLTLDGEDLGFARGIFALRVPMGEHTLEVEAEGCAPVEEQRFTVEDPSRRSFAFQLDELDSPYRSAIAYSPLDERVRSSLATENLRVHRKPQTRDRFTDDMVYTAYLGQERDDRPGVALFRLDLPPERGELVARSSDPFRIADQIKETDCWEMIEMGVDPERPGSMVVVSCVGWQHVPPELGPGARREPFAAEAMREVRELLGEERELWVRWTIGGGRPNEVSSFTRALSTSCLARRAKDGALLWDPALVVRVRTEPWVLPLAPAPPGDAPRVVEVGEDPEVVTLGGEPVSELAGGPLAGGIDLDGDGLADWVVGRGAAGPAGRVWVLSGADGALLDMFEGRQPGDAFGASLALLAAGADGSAARVAIGALQAGRSGRGRGYVELRAPGASGSTSLLQRGTYDGDLFGLRVCAAGDVDADGRQDLLVASHQYENRGIGYAQVFSGAGGEPLLEFRGERIDDHFGNSAAAAGDVDGDGCGDLIVGAYDSDEHGHDSGAAYVFSGRTGERLHLFPGYAANDHAGASVCGAGDVDGDQYADVAVGMPGHDAASGEAGVVVVFSGRTGEPLSAVFGTGEERLGASVRPAGDLDGDGRPGLVVVNRHGTRAVVFRAATGEPVLELRCASGGLDPHPAPDLDGDGRADLILGLTPPPTADAPPGIAWLPLR